MVLGVRMQFKSKTEEKAAHASELDALKSQLDEMEKQLEEARAEAKAAKESTKNVQAELAALHGRFTESLAAKEEAERSLNKTRSELEAAGSAAAEERTRHGSVIAGLQATHTQELARLRDEVAANKQEQQNLVADLKQRSLALAEATAARKAAEEAAETNVGKNQVMCQLKAEVEAAVKSKAAAETEARQLRAELEEKSMKWIREMEQQKKELKDALADAQQQKARADSAEPRAAEAEQRAKEAKDEADALGRKHDDCLTTLAAERRALEAERDGAREARAEAEKQRIEAKAADAECRLAKQVAAEECGEMRRKAESANDEAAELRQQREALQQQLKSSYDEAAQRTETISKLEEEAAESKETISKLENELRKFRAEAAAVNPAQLLLLHDKGREVEFLKKERASISDELERLQLGIAWDSTADDDKAASREMVFKGDCCPVPPKGHPPSKCGTRPQGGFRRPMSARRSHHAARRSPSMPKSPGKVKAATPCF